MSKIILFSPVGGTDPIDQCNYCDGSMLHICRMRRVDEVYLFLSAEMAELQEKDQRFTRALELLGKKQQREIKIHLMKNQNLIVPHKFDQFYDVFSKHVKEISHSMEADDTLLFNVSSGTPAMKSAPLVLTSLGEISCACVQVATPTKKMGNHIHEELFDLDTLWELDPDNKDNTEDRTEDISCPSLSLIKDRQRIINFVQKHEYAFAYSLAQELPQRYTKGFIKYLEFAKERSLFNLHRAVVLEKELGLDCLPVRNAEYRDIVEYALICDLKLRRHELADFLRSLTPLLQELYLKIIEGQLNLSMNPIKDNAYVKYDKYKRLSWNEEILLNHRKWNNEVDFYLCKSLENWAQDKHLNEFDFGCLVSNDHLAEIIKSICEGKNLDKLRDLVKVLRDTVEIKLRNQVAHKIVQITDDLILRVTNGIAATDIMAKLRKLFEFIGLKDGEKKFDEYWSSYDKMNEIVISKILEQTNADQN